MTHDHPTRRFLARTACASIAALLAGSPAIAQEDGGSEDASLPDLSGIKEQLVDIRGLEFKQPVPAEKQSLEDFRAYVKEDLELYFPEERLEGMAAGLIRLGVMKEKLDLGEAFVDAMVSQAGAYYDPVDDKFYYLMTDIPADMIRIFAAHELVHALQDQHFPLEDLLTEFENAPRGGPRNDDYILAVRCLVEGEATYVHTIWQMQEMMGMDITANPNMERMQFRQMASMDVEQLAKMAQAQMGEALGEDNDLLEAVKAMDEIPAYILHPLYAAYMNGAYFVMSVRQKNGWESVAQAWKDMPASTEQCLHPEKYTAEQRDVPTRLDLPAFEYLADEAWREVDSSIHGELYMSILLRENGVPLGDARAAAAGWDGDIYRAYRNDVNDTSIVLATTWDTPDDAGEFAEAYRTALEGKYPNIEFGESRDGYLKYSCGQGLGAGLMRHRGQEVFIVEGFAENLTNRVMADLIGMEIDRIDTAPVKPAEAVEVVGDDAQAAADADPEKRRVVRTVAFDMSVPAAWDEEEPETDTRTAEFVLPSAEGVEGDARLVVYYFGERYRGDVQAVLDRWIYQFGENAAYDIEEAEVDGLDVTTIDIAGRYVAEKAPGSGEYYDRPNQRMLATVVKTGKGPFFFKLVGPKETVDKWADAYRRVIDTLDRYEG